MSFSRSITIAALAGGLMISAYPAAMAQSTINDTRMARIDYCLNSVPSAQRRLCMQQTSGQLNDYQSQYRDCLNDPQKEKATCDAELAANLSSMPQ